MNQRALRFWHKRFTQQARWTSELRQYFFNKIVPPFFTSTLEIGCGTGAILNKSITGQDCWGIDINRAYLLKAMRTFSSLQLINADGYALPFRDKSFSVVYCHYLLLWIKQPLDLIIEMMRVTEKGGYVAFFAEPDYTPEKDLAPELKIIKRMQSESLIQQGANPFIGSQLRNLMECAALHNTKFGEYLSFSRKIRQRDLIIERKVFESDYSYIAKKSIQQLNKFRKIVSNNSLSLHTRTFYAFGQVSA